jgi:hypothetical protein
LGEPLKAKPTVSTKLALGINRFDNERALDSHTPVALLVETRLVGKHMARLQGDAWVAKRLWAFMHSKERTDAVTCTMEVV